MSDPSTTLGTGVDFLTGRRMAPGLAPFHDALALPTDRQYGIDPGYGNERGYAFNQWLPFITNREGSASWVQSGADPQWSLPGILREGLKGWLDLLGAKDTGSLTPEALASFLAGSAGAGMAGAPAGALTAAGRRVRPGRDALPMDEASRYSRAREQGWRPEVPLYHATAGDDFSTFALPPPTTTLGIPPVGVWTTANPDFAGRFPVRVNARTGELVHGSQMPGHRILPLVARWNRLVEVPIAGNEGPFGLHGAVLDAWDKGYDAVRFVNAPGATTGLHDTYVFRQPNQLRSRFAKFDPANRDSDDLLATRALPGLNVAPPGFDVPEQKRQGSLADFRRFMAEERVY
jgi:hypothetical protein